MGFFKKQPKELTPPEMQQTCWVCKENMDIGLKQSTTFRGNWVHVWCWKKII